MSITKAVLVAYFVLVVLGALRMRRLNIDLIDVLVFIGNACVSAWLLFLFSFLSSNLAPSNRWMSWGCLLLSALFYPITVRGIVLGLRMNAKADHRS